MLGCPRAKRGKLPALAIVCLLLGAGGLQSAAAQEPIGIEGPAESEPGNLVILRATGSATGHTWLILPPEYAGNFLAVMTPDGSQAAVFASSRSGVYWVVLAGVDGEKAVSVAHRLSQGTPPPPPIPDPDDPDIPDPPVDDEPVAVVVVYEEGSVVPHDAETIAQLRKHFDGTPIKFFALDVEDKDEDGQAVAKPYIEAAGVGPPCAVVYGRQAVIWKGELPATAEELIGHVQ